MPDTRKLLVGAALAASLTGGAVAGALFGTPVLTGAQESGTTTTAAPPGDGTDGAAGRDCPGPGPGHHRFDHTRLEAAAEALGMTEDELLEALRDGSTIADVAAEQGVDVQTVVDALVAAVTEAIDERVAAGDLDADRAAVLKEDLPERMTDLVNGELRPRWRR